MTQQPIICPKCGSIGTWDKDGIKCPKCGTVKLPISKSRNA